MNEKQKKWADTMCSYLKKYLEKHESNGDIDFEAAAGYIHVIVSLSNDNAEVREALFDIIEPYDKKARELIA